MKIELELPDWVAERGLHILAGIERVAYKLPWEEKWSVKTGRCSSCGKCCERIGCRYLDEEPGGEKFRCSEGVMRPWLCCVSKPRNIPECTVRFEEV